MSALSLAPGHGAHATGWKSVSHDTCNNTCNTSTLAGNRADIESEQRHHSVTIKAIVKSIP